MDINIRIEQLYEDVINLGYAGEALNKDIFIRAFDNGPPNRLFANIVSWLSSELVRFCDLECKVSPLEDTEDLEINDIGFMVELSSLLKELNCPVKRFTLGSIENRMIGSEDQVIAMMFISSELQAAKIIYLKKPKKQTQMKIELDESRTAKELKEMLISLSFGKPPDNITPQQLFGEVDKKIKHLSQPSTPKEFAGERLFSGYLTEKQWFLIDDLYKELYEEYKIRRNLLITRLNVTIESFLWADRLKSKVPEIRTLYDKLKLGMLPNPNVKISDILAACSDLTVIEKTSSAAVRRNTKSSVNKVLIGAVPDRGGRPEEQQPPPPEIPSWQKNDSSSRGGFRQGDNQRQGDSYRQSDRQRQGDSYRQTDRPKQDDYSRQSGRGRQNDDQRYSDKPRQGDFRQNDRSGQYQSNRQGDRPREYQHPNAGYQPRPYMDVRADYNPTFNPPNAQPLILGQIPQQFGFGGYGGPVVASDNFGQFGNQQSAPSGGDGYRQRGRGGGGRGSRPYRGSGQPRNRY